MKKTINLVPIDVIGEKVAGYVKEYFKEDKILFDPIFREEKEKYYLGYMVVEFVDEKSGDYRYKRPTKWLLVDIVSGDLVGIYDSREYDYTDKLSHDSIFANNSSSSLFDASNHVLTSFCTWKKQVIKELEKKFKNSNLNLKILKSDDELISPNSFVLANLEPILEEVNEKIMLSLGGKIHTLYREYYIDTIDDIRKQYIDKGDINKTLLANYIDLIKYLWPDTIDIINAFDNIEHPKNLDFENKLRQIAQDKKVR